MSWGNLSQQIKLTDISKGHGPIFPYTFSIVAPVACLARGRSLACPPGDKSRWSSNFKIALIPSTPSKLWYYYFFFSQFFAPYACCYKNRIVWKALQHLLKRLLTYRLWRPGAFSLHDRDRSGGKRSFVLLFSLPTICGNNGLANSFALMESLSRYF